jgi:predicted Zn-dependent protease
MKPAVFVLAVMFLAGAAAPAQAQLGGLGKIKRLGDKAVDTKQKVDDMTFTDEEEQQMGERVSLQLRNRFGVYQDAAVTKYVTLVGSVLAASSTRPKLDWKFIVLDTDGVNAYAAPGGFVHITRGLLGLMKSEAQLAGVLGHEITHITSRHTINAIKKSKGISLASDLSGTGASLKTQVIAKFAGIAFEKLYEGEWSRDDEDNSDEVGAQIANKTGYAPGGMVEVLKMLSERNAGRQERNGLFASHPSMKDRIANIEKLIKAEKLTGTATADARYKSAIKFEAKEVTEIAVDVEGAAGLAGGDKKKADEKKAEDTKKPEEKKGRTFGLSGITASKQNQSGQQVASAGARGGVPDRDAVGGPNKNALGVKISAAEIEAFKKGIAS